MASQTAFITPELVKWAIERAGISAEIVAQRLRREPDEIRAWQSGTRYPTIRQAEDLARSLRVPFGYLFLSNPPIEDLPLPDFRTFPSQASPEVSLDLREVVNDVIVKMNWYRSFLNEEGAEPLPLVGRFSTNDKPLEVAGYISRVLRIDDLRVQGSNLETYLRLLVGAAESYGVIVMRSSIVRAATKRPLSTQEFRGFAISDPIAPLVFINTKDYLAARIFTFMHEIAHLAIGESGISNQRLGTGRFGSSKSVEVFCNKVAAEVLIPERHFHRLWKDERPVESNLIEIRKQHRVSSLVVLIRALDLQKIGWGEFEDRYRDAERGFSEREESKKEKTTETKRGGDFYNNLSARNSKRLTAAIVSAAFNGRLPYRDAASFLSVRIPILREAASKLGVID